MRSMYDATLRHRTERYGAASTTIEALMYESTNVWSCSVKRLDCRRRLSELSREQLHEVILRLMRPLRSRYPAITDELLYQLGEQL